MCISGISRGSLIISLLKSTSLQMEYFLRDNRENICFVVYTWFSIETISKYACLTVIYNNTYNRTVGWLSIQEFNPSAVDLWPCYIKHVLLWVWHMT